MTVLTTNLVRRGIHSLAGRIILTKSNINGTSSVSSFRTWSAVKDAPQWLSQKFGNMKMVTGGAVIVIAGTAMYPTGKHSYYPGIPIPVTSLNRAETSEGNSSVEVVVIEKLEESIEVEIKESQNQTVTPDSKIEEPIPLKKLEESKEVEVKETPIQPDNSDSKIEEPIPIEKVEDTKQLEVKDSPVQPDTSHTKVEESVPIVEESSDEQTEDEAKLGSAPTSENDQSAEKIESDKATVEISSQDISPATIIAIPPDKVTDLDEKSDTKSPSSDDGGKAQEKEKELVDDSKNIIADLPKQGEEKTMTTPPACVEVKEENISTRKIEDIPEKEKEIDQEVLKETDMLTDLSKQVEENEPKNVSAHAPTAEENAPDCIELRAISKEDAQIPNHVPYLLIGAGTASFAAYRAIKSRDPTAKILIVGEENRLPYMRPPLSKELWYPPLEDVTTNEDGIEQTITKLAPTLSVDDTELRFRQWNGRERSLYYEPEQFYTPVPMLQESKNGGISVLRGKRVDKIDSENQIAYLDDGHKISFEKCLIATGGTPRNLDVLKSESSLNDKVTLFRKVEDYFKLNDITQKIKSVSIIGGGFLGSELACALGSRSRNPDYDLSVTQIYRENGNMAKVLPDYLSVWTTEKVKAEGVNVINNVEVKSAKIDESTGKVSLSLNDGQVLETDHVIVAVGIEPEINLAKNSGLEIDNNLGGFKVNEELEARSNVWVAGDAACFYDPQLGRRRVEHHDHAVVSGRLAGENMVGSHKAYTHQSMFWSDLGPDVGYEAIGLVDSKLPTVGVFAVATDKDTPKGIVSKTDESMRSESEAKVPETVTGTIAEPPAVQENYGKGVIFYLSNDIVVGILMWNVFNKMSIARKVIREHKHYDDLSEVAKLFNIHENEE